MKQKSESIVSYDLTVSSNNYSSSDNGSCCSDSGNLSPTAINLLPRNLLDSPVSNGQHYLQSSSSPLPFIWKQKKSYFQAPVMKLKSNSNNVQVQMFDNNTGIITTSDTMSNKKINKSLNNCLKGFYLKTTKSNIKFIIEDPYIIENLILLPMTYSFIHLSKKLEWDLKSGKSNFNFNNKATIMPNKLRNISSSSSSNYITDYSSSSSTPPPPTSISLSHQHMLNQTKHILLKLCEDYLETYGYSKRAKLFVKYVMRNFPECEEKVSLLKLLKKYKLPIDSLDYSSYDLSKNHHDDISNNNNNNNNNMNYETSDYLSSITRLSSYSPSSSRKSFSSLSSSSISALYSPQCPYQYKSFLANGQGYQHYDYYQYSQSFSPESFDYYSLNEKNTLPFEYGIYKPSKVTLSSNLSNHNMQTNNISTRFNPKKAKKVSVGDKKNERMRHLNIRYKSQVCKHFQERDGYCPVGSKCHFAHGNQELRDPKSHPKFRSQLCRYYSTNGYCIYGDNCYFKHSSKNSSSQTVDITSETVNNKENQLPESTSHRNEQPLNSKKKKKQKNKLQNFLE